MKKEYGRIPEWPKGADCKSVVNDFDGSNPSSPTKILVRKNGDFYFFRLFVNSGSMSIVGVNPKKDEPFL